MTNEELTSDQEELSVYPTDAPLIIKDLDSSDALISAVLRNLADVVDVDDAQLNWPTPCGEFNVHELRQHVLGWLQFFTAALCDPSGAKSRPDPESFTLEDGALASAIVLDLLALIRSAIAAGVADQTVVMSGSLMAGDGVLAMMLGEYIIHAWDLASATGVPYTAPDTVIAPAHEFLNSMVTPEYRGPDSQFFDVEVSVPPDASALERLLGFAGRDPHWTRA